MGKEYACVVRLLVHYEPRVVYLSAIGHVINDIKLRGPTESMEDAFRRVRGDLEDDGYNWENQSPDWPKDLESDTWFMWVFAREAAA